MEAAPVRGGTGQSGLSRDADVGEGAMRSSDEIVDGGYVASRGGRDGKARAMKSGALGELIFG